MPHHYGPGRTIRIVTRKVFENFDQCGDARAWSAASDGESDLSWIEVQLRMKYVYPEKEHLRQWLLANGASVEDQYVMLEISR